MDLEIFERKLHSLTVFHTLMEQPLFKKLVQCLQSRNEPEFIERYSALCSYIYSLQGNLSRAVYELVMNDENFYVMKKGAKEPVSFCMEASVQRELGILQEVLDLKSADLKTMFDTGIELADWDNEPFDLAAEYARRISGLSKKGYGMFARFHMFGLDENGLFPIQHPDPQLLKNMTGYERERDLLVKNTLAFLQGMKANNALLYGDAGTGKSSTIKAIVNEYWKDGLRLVEVKKAQIRMLPALIESLGDNPLKFIIFIDDLSFTTGDDDFIAFKNILEGGSVAPNRNVIVYATSNRRHLVKESFAERDGSEIHRSDTIQETASLAARFGLTITFSKPAKDLYLDIVKSYAQQYDLELTDEELFVKAEAFALRNNGRSPRTARQFAEHQKILETMKD